MEIKYAVGDVLRCRAGYGVCITDDYFILVEGREGNRIVKKLAKIPEDSVPVHEDEEVSCDRSTIFIIKSLRMTALACTKSINDCHIVTE